MAKTASRTTPCDMADLLSFTDRGIHCAEGGFYIDPWRPVDRALITHAHADHARPGHARYLSTHETLPVMRHRLGQIRAEGIAYGEARTLNGVAVSFHPAGHVPGSAQIRVERGGEVWVVSGDYKTEADRLSAAFAPVRCHAFVTECTFGLPVFRWRPEAEVAQQINAWWRANRAAGRMSVLGAYSLGKAQRVLSLVDPEIGPILTHGAVENINDVLRDQGLTLPRTTRITPELAVRDFAGALVVAPPSVLGSDWLRRLGSSATAIASGWMQLRGVRRRRGAERGFVLSDHADWAGLNAAISDTGAERVFATHGYTEIFRRWLGERGFDARVAATEYEGESLEADPPDGVDGDERETPGGAAR